MANIEEKVESLIQDEVTKLGYELYDVQYAKEGKDYYLKIFIDKVGGIDLNDCEKVNDCINPILDKADYIKEMYFLEVSSPGIERTLRKDKHLYSAIGKQIEIKLFKQIEKQKQYIGTLEKYDENFIYIQVENRQIAINRKDISSMKLYFNWN